MTKITKARLTRVEQQALTREQLIEAAERVFTAQGFHATSVDQIAEEAGFSKGAVYSNFEGKDELLLAVLQRRFDSRALGVETAVDGSQPITAQASQAGEAFVQSVIGDPQWSLLLIEYSAHAARHPELRERFAERNRRMRASVAEMIESHLEALGLVSPIPSNVLSTIVFTLGTGMVLETLTDPGGVPSSAFGDALALLFAGVVAGQPPA